MMDLVMGHLLVYYLEIKLVLMMESLTAHSSGKM